jgi:hypothetical protein
LTKFVSSIVASFGLLLKHVENAAICAVLHSFAGSTKALPPKALLAQELLFLTVSQP